MTDLSAFPITRRWPATDPEAIQLYAFPTPNGVKISIALEELGLRYEAHKVTLKPEDVKSPAFLSLNPNGKIPAIIDPNGPDGAPLGLFESGAILIYLAEKTGRLMGNGTAERLEVLQWLMFQMAGIGPMFGQLGFFYRGEGASIQDRRAKDRYIAETRRLLSVIETRLDGGLALWKLFHGRHRHRTVATDAVPDRRARGRGLVGLSQLHRLSGQVPCPACGAKGAGHPAPRLITPSSGNPSDAPGHRPRAGSAGRAAAARRGFPPGSHPPRSAGRSPPHHPAARLCGSWPRLR